jgi:hypothetical protein
MDHAIAAFTCLYMDYNLIDEHGIIINDHHPATQNQLKQIVSRKRL